MLLFVALAALSTGAGAAPLSDPTRPYRGAGATNEAAAPELQSTLVSPGRKSAVINGARVRVGDDYRGAVVTEITPYEVRLDDGGREIRLRLLPRLIKHQGVVE